jgi:hypothetical protein
VKSLVTKESWGEMLLIKQGRKWEVKQFIMCYLEGSGIRMIIFLICFFITISKRWQNRLVAKEEQFEISEKQANISNKDEAVHLGLQVARTQR